MEELTKKQKGFVKDYIKDENGTQAALNNYDTTDPNTAGAIASENLRKPKIIEVLKTLAENIPDELVTAKHLALLNKADKEGNIDVQAVSKGLDMAYKLKGSYEEDKQKSINILMPILVKFLNIKDEGETKGDNNGNTDRVSQTI